MQRNPLQTRGTAWMCRSQESWETENPTCLIQLYWVSSIHIMDMGMDQYLLIPFLGGWTSIYQLFWCSPGVQGFDTLPYRTGNIMGIQWDEKPSPAVFCGGKNTDDWGIPSTLWPAIFSEGENMGVPPVSHTDWSLPLDMTSHHNFIMGYFSCMSLGQSPGYTEKKRCGPGLVSWKLKENIISSRCLFFAAQKTKKKMSDPIKSHGKS